LVHRWRSEESSILVGTNTALIDDPELTNRYWPGASPIRLVIDMDLKLPSSLKMFNDKKSFTIVFNARQHQLDVSSFEKHETGLGFYQITSDASVVHQLLNALQQLKVASVMVEGGTKLLQSFIDEGLWDEARVITNAELEVPTGLAAPMLSNHQLFDEVKIISDQIHYFANIQSLKHRTV
jgi:diaminohydroxyphosphoribosylaminopyrimidine deaminase/5-amino-6-(5-phosphoribosylamino)uracil reductase